MKLPPYGKTLESFLSQGKTPKNDIYCFCGANAWLKAKFFGQYQDYEKNHPTLCLPPYEDPRVYFWPVSKCNVILFNTGNLEPFYIEEIAFYLLKAGALIVRAVDFNQKISVYKQTENVT